MLARALPIPTLHFPKQDWISSCEILQQQEIQNSLFLLSKLSQGMNSGCQLLLGAPWLLGTQAFSTLFHHHPQQVIFT